MSSTSPKTNQSQTVTQKAISSTQVQGFSAEEQSDTQSKESSNVLEPNAFTVHSSPQQTCETLFDMSFVTPDSSCPASKDSQDEQVSGSASMLAGSGSEQPAPLVSGREMQLIFRPGVLHNREFSDESPKNYQMYTFEDAEDFQTLNLASAAQLVEDEEKSLAEFAQMLIKDGPEVPTRTAGLMEITCRQSSCDGANSGPGSSAEPLAVPESPPRFCEVAELSQNPEVHFEAGEPGDTEQLSSVRDGDATTAEHLAHCHQEDSTAYVPQMIDQESEVCSRHLDGASEEVSPMNTQDDSTRGREVLSIEAIQSENVSSQSLSDATPETVTSARHFSFEELVLGSSLAPPPVASKYFGSSVPMKSEMTLLNSEGRSTPSGHADTVGSPRSTNEYTKVEHRGKSSPEMDCSDPEGYFDCKQAASELSEPDEPDPCDRFSSVGMPEKATERVLVSSESEEYEDAPFVHEPPRVGHVDSEEWSRSSEPSDDEFTLCEASQPAGDGTDNYLTRVRRAAVVEQR